MNWPKKSAEFNAMQVGAQDSKLNRVLIFCPLPSRKSDGHLWEAGYRHF
jgi:hypothetical protein